MRLIYLLIFLLFKFSVFASSVVPCTNYPFKQMDKTTGIRIEGYPDYSTISRKNTIKVFSFGKYLYTLEEDYNDAFYTSLIFTDRSGTKLVSVGYHYISIYDNGVLKSRISYRDFVKENDAYDSLIKNTYINYLFASCDIRNFFWSKERKRKLTIKLQLETIYRSGDSLCVRIAKSKYAQINLLTGYYQIATRSSLQNKKNLALTRVYEDAQYTRGDWILVNKKFISLELFFSERLKLKLTHEDSDSAKQRIFISILTDNKGNIIFPGSKVNTVMCLGETLSIGSSKESDYKKLSEILFQKQFRLLPINKKYKLDYRWQDVEFYIEEKCHSQF